ncbi:replication endonuclease [Zobellella denitrificans]|uniref:replication endonuclease n=1 Tax=Zobellella denitrificans TaxID=347534 RepID=UPI000BBE2531|nr:replication endonuclease [Zobellella denitrificans]
MMGMGYGVDRSFTDMAVVASPYAARGAALEPRYQPFYAGGQSTPFDIATARFGTAECAAFRHRIGCRHMAMQSSLSSFYIRKAQDDSYIEANRALADIDDRLSYPGPCGVFRCSWDDSFISSFAGKLESYFSRLRSFSSSDCDFFVSALDAVNSYALGAPDAFFSPDEQSAFLSRLCSSDWLRLRLRRHVGRVLSDISRIMGLVHKRSQPYVSDYQLARRVSRLRDNKAVLTETVAHNSLDPDEWFTLSELAGKSVSNPVNRRAELMVRCRGFEICAEDLGHVGLFLTLTCPSRFHAFSNSGKPNPNWDGSTIRDSQAWLVSRFNSIRAELNNSGIRPYGFRVAEPHHDGTAHWHLLLFIEQDNVKSLLSIFKRYMLMDSPNEPGAKKHRFKCIFADKSKGSATGYIAKYISKNIDGFAVGQDYETKSPALETAARVDAWKADNGIRQFQQIGGPSVQAWREMRRMRDEFKEDDPMLKHLSNGEWLALENVRRAADASDWAAFCIAMGGVQVRRNDQTIRCHYAVPQAMEKLCSDTGEIVLEPKTTRYGDIASARIVGVMFQRIFVATRFKDWQVVNKKKFLRGTADVMRGVTDIFDAMEAEQEYMRMLESEYDSYVAKMNALADENHWLLIESLELEAEASRRLAVASGSSERSEPWSSVNNCKTH